MVQISQNVDGSVYILILSIQYLSVASCFVTENSVFFTWTHLMFDNHSFVYTERTEAFVTPSEIFIVWHAVPESIMAVSGAYFAGLNVISEAIGSLRIASLGFFSLHNILRFSLWRKNAETGAKRQVKCTVGLKQQLEIGSSHCAIGLRFALKNKVAFTAMV